VKRTLNQYIALCAVALPLGLALLCSGSALAQSTGTADTMQAPDPLRPLTQALSDAGATALTTAQQTAIETLISGFQEANAPSVSSARAIYDTYILSGNATGAASLIPTLIAERSAMEVTRLQLEAAFGAGVIKLFLPVQIAALKTVLDDDEIVQLIQSLAGGPGGPGRNGGPPPRK
jgi:hypothetical protein